MNRFDYSSSDIHKVYAAGRALSVETMQLWMDMLSTTIDTKAVDGIVDLGCGTGRFSAALAEHFGTQVLGVDSGFQLLQRVPAHADVVRIQSAAEQLPLLECVDLVFMSMVYHLLEKPDIALREVFRVLRPGGNFALRISTREDMEHDPMFRFFPGAKVIDLQRMPATEDILRECKSAGLACTHERAVAQIIASDWNEYATRMEQRALSVLRMLSDKEFQAGIAAIRHHAVENSDQTEPIREWLHLFVFRKPG